MTKRICLLLSVFIYFISSGLWAAGNPVFTAADPHAAVFGRQLWVYATGGGRGSEFYAWSTGDFKVWEKHGPLLRLRDAAWVPEDGVQRHSAWAPCIIENGGKYYFYYSVGPQNPTPSRIGVAVGDAPGGPFKDSGKALLTGGNGFEAIDPMVFRDPKGGKHYFYAGGSAGAKLRVFELNADMVSFAREVSVETPPRFTEGPFVHYHQNRYYLSYSHGSYRDASYSVHYCTGASPEGPWTYRGVILRSDARHKGPGHHSFVRMPSGLWLIAYHRWNDRKGNGPYDGARETCIDVVAYDRDGNIRPVVMTDTGYRP